MEVKSDIFFNKMSAYKIWRFAEKMLSLWDFGALVSDMFSAYITH